MYLSVTGLAKQFGDLQVLKDINFSIEKGQVISIIGPSGSGKTTLLRCLNALEIPDNGIFQFEDGFTLDFTKKQKKQDLLRLRRNQEWFFSHIIFFRIRRLLKM